jgi:hypothetical protein
VQQQVDGVAVVGGMFFGWLGSWILYLVASAAYYGTVGDDRYDEVIGLVVGVVALFLVPVAAGVALIRRGRGQLGSGLLVGVAIGSLIGAGVCASVVTGGM